MNARRTRLLLALGSTVAAVLVAAWILRAREDERELVLEPIELDWGGVPVSSAPRPGLDPLAADPSARFPPSTLVRRTIGPEEAERLFALASREFDEYDPQCYFRKKAGLDGRRTWLEHPDGHYTYHTNSLGLRGAAEPAAAPPDLRILVLGDSHSEGVCHDEETYAARLEGRLREAHPGRAIEVLNAARGGYSFFHYLGALERLLPLAPDVLVVGIYGGNDFEEALTLHHFFQGTERPPTRSFQEQRESVMRAHGSAVGQALNGCKYFAVWPAEIDSALQAARDCCTELQVLCLRRSIRPLFVYLPSAADVEPQRHPKLGEAAAMLELSDEAVRVNDRMADSLLAFLRQRGLAVLDLRPAFRAAPATLYWKADLHMNLEAQRLVADELFALLERDAARPRVREAPAKAR